jgi:predicted nucleic acid-binding protein
MLASARQRGEHFVLAATVYTESLVGSYRHDEPTAADRRRRLLGLFGPVRVVDDAVADLAARLRATHRWLRTPDALVIATGIMDNAEIVTCDKRLADVDDRVKVLLSG